MRLIDILVQLRLDVVVKQCWSTKASRLRICKTQFELSCQVLHSVRQKDLALGLIVLFCQNFIVVRCVNFTLYVTDCVTCFLIISGISWWGLMAQMTLSSYMVNLISFCEGDVSCRGYLFGQLHGSISMTRSLGEFCALWLCRSAAKRGFGKTFWWPL